MRGPSEAACRVRFRGAVRHCPIRSHSGRLAAAKGRAAVCCAEPLQGAAQGGAFVGGLLVQSVVYYYYNYLLLSPFLIILV